MKTSFSFFLLVTIAIFHVACEKDNLSKRNTPLNKIIYQHEVAPNQKQLYIVDADGSNQIALTSTSNMTASYVDWSSDGEEILFNYRGIGIRQFNDIYRVAVDGSGMTPLTNTPNDSEIGATFSDDDSKFLYLSDRVLFVSDRNGSNKLRLTNPNGLLVSRAFWSSDASKIIFSAQAAPYFYSIDVDGSNLTALSINNSATFGIPTLSAYYDNKLLFLASSTTNATNNTSQLFEFNTDGTNAVQLTNDSDKVILKADLSPDKSKLLLQAYVYSSSKIEYFVSNINGTNQQKLINDADYYISNISWSPNSDQLVFSAYARRTTQTDIFTVNTDGTNLTQITNDLFAESNPIWK